MLFKTNRREKKEYRLDSKCLDSPLHVRRQIWRYQQFIQLILSWFVFCVCMSTVDENNELPEDFDEEFFREIHQKGGMATRIYGSLYRLRTIWHYQWNSCHFLFYLSSICSWFLNFDYILFVLFLLLSVWQ